MKKILLVISLLTALLMTGCNKRENVENTDAQPSPTIQQAEEPKEEKDSSSIVTLNSNSPYVSTLENLYNNLMLPDGTKLYNLDGEEKTAENQFAVFDIDSDGRKELIFSYTTGTMADIIDYIFDHDTSTGEITLESEFNPSSTYYSNGYVKELAKHNQGMEDPWPYSLYKYNSATDKYDVIDKNVQELGKEIAIPFQNLTLENIESLKKNSMFVNLSDSYYFSDYKKIEMKEIVPIGIYLTDENSAIHVNRYGEDVSIMLPIEKCESADEERIVYAGYYDDTAEYKIEKMLNTGKVRIGGIEIETIHPDSPTDDNFSFKEEVAHYYNLGLQKIYEVELDNDSSTKELLVYSHFSYPWDSYEYPYLVKIENGIATDMGLIENENIMQIGSYKNVFTDGWNSDVEEYFSNVLMGYYVYDKEIGLVHIEKMANGDDIANIDIVKLDSCILDHDIQFGKTNTDDSYSDIVSYSTWAYGDEAEIKTLTQGTKIKVTKIIDEYGNFIGETEDGISYGFFSFAGRT